MNSGPLSRRSELVIVCVSQQSWAGATLRLGSGQSWFQIGDPSCLRQNSLKRKMQLGRKMELDLIAENIGLK